MCCPACLRCLGEQGRFFFFSRAKRKVPSLLPLSLLSLSLATVTTLDNLFFFLFLSSCDSLMVEMKSWKRSFGNRGFSRPRKYSLSTPATELMSCSFWSSIRGSSPGFGRETLERRRPTRIRRDLSSELTSLKGVFNVVNFHVRSWHTENALLLKACEGRIRRGKEERSV